MTTPYAPTINWVSRDTNNYITISLHQSWASSGIYIDAYDDDNYGNNYWTGVYGWYYPGANDFTISFGWDSKSAISDQDYTYFRARCIDGSDIGPWSGTSSGITKYVPTPPAEPYWGGYTSYTTTTCQISFYSHASAYYVRIYCNGSYYYVYTYNSAGTYYYTIPGLAAGTGYTVYLQAFDSQGYSSGQSGWSIQTLYECPTPNYGATIGVSPDGGYLYMGCTDAYGWGLEYDIRSYPSGGSWSNWASVSTPYYAIVNLAAGTTCQFRARYANPSSSYQKATSTSSWGWAYSSTYTRPAKPSTFAWTYSKAQGGVFNLTSTEWNSFRSRVAGYRDYKILSPYSYSSVSTGGQVYATDFTQTIDKLNDMVSLAVYSKYTGDPIVASELNAMVTALNSIT